MRRRSSMRRSTSRLRRAGLSVRGARAGTTKSSSSREEEITNLLALNASVVAGERHPSEKVAYCQKATTVSFLRQRKLRSRSRVVLRIHSALLRRIIGKLDPWSADRRRLDRKSVV